MFKEAERTFCEILKVYIEGEKKKKRNLIFQCKSFLPVLLLFNLLNVLRFCGLFFFFLKYLKME